MGRLEGPWSRVFSWEGTGRELELWPGSGAPLEAARGSWETVGSSSCMRAHPTRRHVMKELLDTERVYVEELLCVLEVRVVSSHYSPTEPAGPGPEARGRRHSCTGRVCMERERLLPRGRAQGFWVRDARPQGLGCGRARVQAGSSVRTHV